MADLLDENGLTLSTLPELIEELEDGLKEIYGDDINLEQNSPDGQMINLYAQQAIDNREILSSSFNSFNPDSASGVVLDQRVVINDIERKGGTYTIQPIDITVDRVVELDGLDEDYNESDGTGYTVQDDSGNEFILIDTVTLSAGTSTKNFRAKELGLVETVIGTITNPVTIILGVTTVYNSVGALEIGTTQETDAQLKVRRARSVSNNATGYLNGLRGRLLELDGVSEAIVEENDTNATDADGTLAHTIWTIVEGGANDDIALAIMATKTAGTGQRGAVEVEVMKPTGDYFTAKFDRPVATNLYVQFDIQKTTGTLFDESGIKDYIVDNKTYTIGEFAETSSLTAIALEAIDSTGGGGVPVNIEISDDGTTWVDYLETATKKDQWTLDITNIGITVL